MNGVHDMGGMDGFGKVEAEENEPPFHEKWEGRVMAMQRSMGYAGAWHIDDGRYAQSPLKSWFDSLRSGKGLCCSDADGSAVADVDWESKDGHYRVRLEGQWIDVPDDAVVTVPNRAGRTMVWPVQGAGGISIRCFLPGSMM